MINRSLRFFLLIIACVVHATLEARVIRVSSLDKLQEIINRHSNVIVKFYAHFCSPCKSFAPIYKQVSEQSAFNSIVFVEVDSQESQAIVNTYGIRSLPTLIFIQNKVTRGFEIGGKTMDQFTALIKKYCY